MDELKYKIRKDLSKVENGITIYEGINNLFDKLYFEYVGSRIYTVMPTDRRTFYMGIKYKF